MVHPKSIEYQEVAEPSWPTGPDRVGRRGAPLAGVGFQNNHDPIPTAFFIHSDHIFKRLCFIPH